MSENQNVCLACGSTPPIINIYEMTYECQKCHSKWLATEAECDKALSQIQISNPDYVLVCDRSKQRRQ